MVPVDTRCRFNVGKMNFAKFFVLFYLFIYSFIYLFIYLFIICLFIYSEKLAELLPDCENHKYKIKIHRNKSYLTHQFSLLTEAKLRSVTENMRS